MNTESDPWMIHSVVTHKSLKTGRAIVAICFTLLTITLLAFSGPSHAVVFETYQAKVVGISDGDSITVLRDKQQVKIRLNGIDAPESGQAFSKRAKQWTGEMCMGKTVTIKEVDLDRYDRVVAEVTLPDGRSLNQEIVRAGFAWWFRKYSDDQTLKALEEEARAARRGLWYDKEPIPPWEYRRAKDAGKALIE